MRFDIRLPIGLLFLMIGLVLTAYGLLSGPAIYRAHSLGVNVNLIWGLAMAAFGLVMLALAAWASRRAGPGAPEES